MAFMNITRDGSDLLLAEDDGTFTRFLFTGAAFWIPVAVSNDPEPPEPSGDFRFPFPRELITGIFPGSSSYFGHSGIDWPGGRVGDTAPIKAIGPGVVINRTVEFGNNPDNFNDPFWRGCSITLDHGDIDGVNIQSIYAHMREAPMVQMGETVTGGQQIGILGNTGASDGAHLHHEIVFNGQRLPTSTPGNNIPGLGWQRAVEWLDAHTDGSSW